MRVTNAPRSGTILRVTLIISLLFHLGLLLVIQATVPLNWLKPEPLRTYYVELLRPPVDPFQAEDMEETDLQTIQPQKETPPLKSEDTISLNTRDKRYSPYAKVIKRRLMEHWKYPPKAWQALGEGEVLVIFTLNRKGQLEALRLLEPSAFSVLDDETLRAIQAAAPFPPFPGSVRVGRLNIKAKFSYRLTASR